jgi:hypothetical protein
MYLITQSKSKLSAAEFSYFNSAAYSAIPVTYWLEWCVSSRWEVGTLPPAAKGQKSKDTHQPGKN